MATAPVERMARWLYQQFGNPARDFEYLGRREKQTWRNHAIEAVATVRGHQRVGAGFAEPGMIVDVWATEGSTYEVAARWHASGRARWHHGRIEEIHEDRESEDVRIKLSNGQLLATKSYAATFVTKKASRK